MRRQWIADGQSPDSGSSSHESEPDAHGVCGASTNPIILVSRVTMGLPGAARLRQRGRNDGPFPLPLLMTIPVSFERWREFSATVRASIANNAALSLISARRPRCTRKWFSGNPVRGEELRAGSAQARPVSVWDYWLKTEDTAAPKPRSGLRAF